MCPSSLMIHTNDVEAQGPKTVMRYDHGRENLEQNAVNFLRYEDEP